MAATIAYKVLTGPQMATLEHEGSFAGAPIDLADGYIHLSTAEQLDETLAKHFAGQDDLHIAAVDLDAQEAESVRWEPSRGGALFPHLYAPLLLETVIAYGPIERNADGTVRLPVAG
ncbi:DUF952 domain-containing protein [Sphingomonas oligophenolica]|uniref:DUF952 domain-containing protein n=1 Tax=Sphingomonas oligophenolica TaxID=301154 RepID=A0ABU9Y9A8_9SPHN